ncbi:MAG TPA: prepilin-type N-terminal cleavage/methylation domain-containing protein [Gemmatimonadaceae bacterium]|nr:prepilin-type N-terminal cleavage/methylation domain-containing protein [Gemmatimonadaceae bacterium]
MRSRRAGFTLIEVMVVVVILAILAAMAIPRFKNTKGKGHSAALRTDLRNLATAEESFFFSNGRYSTVLDSLNFRGSPGVIVTIPEASNQGWSASVTHPESYPLKCAMFEGTAAPLAPATAESQISCR